jgi:hypothetical protein
LSEASYTSSPARTPIVEKFIRILKVARKMLKVSPQFGLEKVIDQIWIGDIAIT